MFVLTQLKAVCKISVMNYGLNYTQLCTVTTGTEDRQGDVFLSTTYSCFRNTGIAFSKDRVRSSSTSHVLYTTICSSYLIGSSECHMQKVPVHLATLILVLCFNQYSSSVDIIWPNNSTSPMPHTSVGTIIDYNR